MAAGSPSPFLSHCVLYSGGGRGGGFIQSRIIMSRVLCLSPLLPRLTEQIITLLPQEETRLPVVSELSVFPPLHKISSPHTHTVWTTTHTQKEHVVLIYIVV